LGLCVRIDGIFRGYRLAVEFENKLQKGS